ncbi:MAG: hypothetical protein AB2L07_10830 [Thermoanaerobaculaceae bacterium]
MSRKQTVTGTVGIVALLAVVLAVGVVATSGREQEPCATTQSVTVACSGFADNPFGGLHDSIVNACTAGLISGCGDAYFCPGEFVTREDLAVSLVKGIHGTSPVLPTPKPRADVPVTYCLAGWIGQLFADGIVSSTIVCPEDSFCPYKPATRAEVAELLGQAYYFWGCRAGQAPPAPSGTIFTDVPASHWAAGWIEELHNTFILYASGQNCLSLGSGPFLPDRPVTRAEMACLLYNTFNGAAPTCTPVPTQTPTPTRTATAAPTSTRTPAPTSTATLAPTTTRTPTAAATATRTATLAPTATRTATGAATATRTATPASTATFSATATRTSTVAPTSTQTSTPTRTPSLVPTATPTATATAVVLPYPGNLTASQGDYDDHVMLTWDGVSGATSYKIYRRWGANPQALLATVTGTDHDDYDVQRPRQYYYAVSACNASGCGPQSPEALGFVNLYPTPGTPTPTATYTRTATGVPTVPPTLTRTPTSAATSTATPTRTATLASTATPTATRTWTATTGPTATRTATNAPSATATRTPTAVPTSTPTKTPTAAPSATRTATRTPTPLPYPANLSASQGDYDDRVTLTWDGVPGAASYKIYRRWGANPQALLATVTGTDYDDYDVQRPKQYYYAVSACNASGCGPQSPEVLGYVNLNPAL